MELRELTYAQAAALAGVQEGRQAELLRLLCAAAVTALEARLREGLTADSCKADFVAAAALYALAALEEAGGQMQEFRAGDLVVKQGGSAASRCLRRQAELMMGPYLRDGFAFMGV
ncbi:MAG: hypothetical protein Q4F17_00340 [Eubacteriales bacterium]|nr:hypothetical protein [Eubacteriales bacterium]